MNPWRAWNRFWFAPTSARPLAAFRIAFGLIVLAHVALFFPESDEWLSGVGRLQGSEARELAGPLHPSPLQWVQDPLSIRLFLAGTGVVAAMVTLGWRTRITSVLLYGMLLSIHHRNMASCSGADVLMVVLAFTLMLSPSGAAMSLDYQRARKKLGAVFEPLIVPWAQRLIGFQIAMVYFATAMLKAGGKPWIDGTAVHYVLGNTEFHRLSFGLTAYPTLTSAMTHGAMALEFALAFLLWFKAARPWILPAGLALHAGIMMTVQIPLFSEMMVIGYLTFLGADEWFAMARWFDRKRRSEQDRPEIPGRVDPGTGDAVRGPSPSRRAGRRLVGRSREV